MFIESTQSPANALWTFLSSFRSAENFNRNTNFALEPRISHTIERIVIVVFVMIIIIKINRWSLSSRPKKIMIILSFSEFSQLAPYAEGFDHGPVVCLHSNADKNANVRWEHAIESIETNEDTRTAIRRDAGTER